MKLLKRLLSVFLSITIFVYPVTLRAEEGKINNLDYKILMEVENKLIERASVETVQSATYDTYLMDEAFVCTVLYPNGMSEYACSINGVVYHKIYEEGRLVEAETINRNVSRELSLEESCLLDSFMNDYNETGNLEELGEKLKTINYTIMRQEDSIAIVSDESMTAAVASESITCGMNELMSHSSFGTLNGAYSSTVRFYCEPLSTYKNVIVRDTRTNYVETSYKSGLFLAGSSIAVAAASVFMNPASILSWLGLGLGVSTFPYDVFIHNSVNARAYHYRYGEIYDSTRGRYVTCASEYGYDYFVVSNQGSGYAWGIQYNPVTSLYPDSYIAASAAEAYNIAVERDGYWRW